MARPVLTFSVGASHETTENIVDVKLDSEKPGQHTFTLTVVDENGNVSEVARKEVTIQDPEHPTANLVIEPASVPFGRTFTLDGSHSTELPPGKIKTYKWTMVS